MVVQRPGEGFTGRMRTLVVVVGILLCLVGVRLWSLQVANSHKYEEKGLRNRIRTVVLKPLRGNIYDRNSLLLVGNTLRYDASVSYAEIEKDPKVQGALINVLGRVLGLSEGEVRQRFDPRRAIPYLPLKVKRGITEEQFYRLKSVEGDIPGLLPEVEASREYVEGSLLAHVLGAVGAISPEGYQTYKKWGYSPDDIVGIMGLEKAFERVLQGKKGILKVQVDYRSRLDRVIKEVKPTPGMSLYLTIDIQLQRSAEEALVGKKGAVVALDPRTGDVLAMASSPSFDPNAYSLPRGDKEVEEIQAWGEDPSKPLYNRAISMAYPLGSAFKVMVGLAGLEERKISRATTFHCPGAFYLPGVLRPWRCYHNHIHGSVTIDEALKRSCNVFFYNLGRLVGAESMCSMSAKFHLGKNTGIVLPMEEKGINPDKEWRGSSDPRARPFRVWYAGNTINLSIGQGPLEATPLQTACAYAAIANGGTYYTPRLVARIVGGGKETAYPIRSESVGIRESSLRVIKEGLRKVAQESGGTAYSVFKDVSFLKVAGKTGTAQYGPDNEKAYAWFVGYAPCDSPRIVVVVLVEEGSTGGGTSAPLAKQVMMDFFTMGG
jgi:penicillin-binding protein 2